jgi:hypothetical protein
VRNYSVAKIRRSTYYGNITHKWVKYKDLKVKKVRMAEWSKALRSGRSPLLRAWVRIPLLTHIIFSFKTLFNSVDKIYPIRGTLHINR